MKFIEFQNLTKHYNIRTPIFIFDNFYYLIVTLYDLYVYI